MGPPNSARRRRAQENTIALLLLDLRTPRLRARERGRGEQVLQTTQRKCRGMRSIANQAVRKDRKGVLHVRANVQRMREICKGCTNVLAQKQLANHHTAQTLLIAKMAHSVMELYFRLK